MPGLNLITRSTSINQCLPTNVRSETRLSVPLIPIESSKISLCRRISRPTDPVSQPTRPSTRKLNIKTTTQPCESPILLPIDCVYQVDLPPDIHPLPENINAYVSSSAACFTQRPTAYIETPVRLPIHPRASCAQHRVQPTLDARSA